MGSVGRKKGFVIFLEVTLTLPHKKLFKKEALAMNCGDK
jgi:hypothetical protein